MKTKIHNICLACILVTFWCSAEVDLSVVGFEYYAEGRFSINLVQPGKYYLDNRVLVHFPPVLPLNIIAQDPYNDRKSNSSLSFLYSYFLCQTDWNFGEPAYRNIVLPITLLFSTYHFLPNGIGNIHGDSLGDKTVTGSLFVKNNMDINVFRQNKWVGVYPGVGLSVKLTRQNGFSYGETNIALGVNYVIDILSTESVNRSGYVYFKITLLGLA